MSAISALFAEGNEYGYGCRLLSSMAHEKSAERKTRKKTSSKSGCTADALCHTLNTVAGTYGTLAVSILQYLVYRR